MLYYCHNTDYGCGNLKSLTERPGISLIPRESREVLDCSAGDKGDQSAASAQAPIPVVVQNQQIRARSQRKAQPGKQLSHGRVGGGSAEEEEGEEEAES